ncbi:MAG: hypothetical protein K0R62_2799, partial [Nonomuraea muscovyensis]|nr:hypothetical protein [Nonomuraea muscovyensis]
CGWLALAAALRGGVPYVGRRLRRAAHADRWLRAHAVRRPVPDARPRAERPAGRDSGPQRVTS